MPGLGQAARRGAERDVTPVAGGEQAARSKENAAVLRHAFAAWNRNDKVDEIHDLGDRVLALYRWIGRGRGSHAEAPQ
jgi:hypothetical protein